MASVAPRDELCCPICFKIYTEPVSLRCGHHFCQDCITAALDTQDGFGLYKCPECKEEYPQRPPMEKNRNLCLTIERLRSLQLGTFEVFCTYCVDAPVTAVKTCLHCETSMCDKHLTAHNKMANHVLLQPTILRDKKCSVHKKALEYFCCKDDTYVCASCCLVGAHKGHDVEERSLVESYEEKPRHVVKYLTLDKGTVEEKIHSLQDHKRAVEEKAASEKMRVNDLFEEIRGQLMIQEKRAQREISGQVEQILLSVSNLAQQLEKQNDDWTNPVTCVQAYESKTSDHDLEEPSVSDLDDFLISLMLHNSISDLLTNLKTKTGFPTKDVAHLLLDSNTAHRLVALSDHLMKATSCEQSQHRRNLPERFKTFSQVMTVQGFSGGQHYWEVEVSECGDWDVGMCYPSIDRDGLESTLGENKVSWCVGLSDKTYYAVHDSEEHSLQKAFLPSCKRLGVYLDYGRGRLSFYQMSDPVRHLHTFTATFTEPLHAVFYVNVGAWVKIVY
ncbi:E3 ubiquitin/ISG15 ligase TRIM25-like [Hyperolius riggenbachi]|uniref:E3 ubiquitin/ISG15 ligase TRIM25-like n=1 Tax=Hyperolius riggenbachi TaxID=752182 RepID=UPI0035A2976E